VIVKATKGEAGTITVKVKSEELEDAVVKVNVAAIQ